MKPIFSAEDDDTPPPRPVGERVVYYALWSATIFAALGTTIAFAVDLNLPGHGDAIGAAASVVSLTPGLVVVVVLALAIRSHREQRFWPACRLAGLALLLAIVAGVLYVAGLGAGCGQISSCRHTGAVVDLVAGGQFLFVLCGAAALTAAVASLGVALKRSRSLY